jgi:lipid-A-disaccharide synthase
VILPFEERYFRERGVPATFVGHPLRDRAVVTRATARAQLGLEADRPVLALFPGSRPSERAALWPAFREAARLVQVAHRDLEVIVAASPNTRYDGLDRSGGRLVQAAPLAAAAADAAIAKSGTTTLELALAGTPHVLAYRVHPVTYALARRLVRVPWIGLVNLVAEREVVPELLQSDATPAALADAVRTLLDPQSHAATTQRGAFRDVVARLGPPGAATRAAGLALELAA